MKFKDFMESIDLEEMPDIEFEDDPDSFSGNKHLHTLEIDGIKYTVIFSKVYLYGLKNAYDVSFRGPNRFSKTGLDKQFKVYPKVLSVVKEFINKYQPDGLHFYGFINEMDLVYKKFTDRFFKDEPGKPSNQVFIRINDKDWIRKDAYENLDSVTKQDVDKAIKSWGEKEKKYFDDIRLQKNMRRNLILNARKNIGGFVSNSHTSGLIIGAEGDYIIAVIAAGNRLRYDDYNFYLYSSPIITPPSQATPSMYKKYADIIDLPANMDTFSKMPASVIELLRSYQNR